MRSPSKSHHPIAHARVEQFGITGDYGSDRFVDVQAEILRRMASFVESLDDDQAIVLSVSVRSHYDEDGFGVVAMVVYEEPKEERA